MTTPRSPRGLIFAFKSSFCYHSSMEIRQEVSGMVGTNSYYYEYNGKGYLIDAPDGIGSWAE